MLSVVRGRTIFVRAFNCFGTLGFVGNAGDQPVKLLVGPILIVKEFVSIRKSLKLVQLSAEVIVVPSERLSREGIVMSECGAGRTMNSN